MEDLVVDNVTRASRFHARDLNILVTGHTGFKGAWLCEWLLQMGANVFGIALPPESPDSLFSTLRLEERLDHTVCDIRLPGTLLGAVKKADPEVIFHLAAQALVRRSYREPLATWQINVDGTLNILEAARRLERPVTVIVVTTDKVYKNKEWEYAYREDDELGGYDPYSASKAACEIAVASWRSSFGSDGGVRVVTARAGNVLGPGDFSQDRIIPDCFRAWRDGEIAQIRHPASSRPWQHVLEPLSGYMALAAHAMTGRPVIHACNFGPVLEGHRTVETLVRAMASFDPSRRWTATNTGPEHEACSLSLSIERARNKLNWMPRLTFDEMMAWTNDGYIANKNALPKIIEHQIADFQAKTRQHSNVLA